MQRQLILHIFFRGPININPLLAVQYFRQRIYTKEQGHSLSAGKFDMVDGGNGYFYHQYMTCIFGQANEAAMMKMHIHLLF